MTRQENLILQRDYAKFPPYKNVADYRFSLNETKKTYPPYDWDKPKNHVNQELIEAERDLDNVEQQLLDKRENLGKFREKLEQQWQELETNQTNLKMNFKKFNKFIRINVEKRNRAELTLKDAKETYHEIDKKMIDLCEQYEYLENIKLEMDKKIEENQIYETYLNKVIPLMPGIRNFNLLINRYEALLEARQFLITRQETNLRLLEENKKNVARIIEENNTKLVGLSTQVAHLQSDHQYAYQQAIMWTRIVDKITAEIFNRCRIRDQIELGIYNLYLFMCKRKQIAPEYRNDQFEKQLNFIKKTLEETREISQILTETHRKRRIRRASIIVGATR